MLLHIHGKGKKDRYVPLPEPTLQMLRLFSRTHRSPSIRPSDHSIASATLFLLQNRLTACAPNRIEKSKYTPHTSQPGFSSTQDFVAAYHSDLARSCTLTRDKNP
jgi:hypothetical protein